MRIIIYSPSYNVRSGGIIVLHKLCHILIELGYDAYLYPMHSNDKFYVNSEYKYNIAYNIMDTDIIIYPEIISGNPLNAKYVIRYIMNNGHITLGRKDTWGENDFWLYYSDLFYDGLKEKNILTIIEPFLDIYKDYGKKRIYESCHTFRKNENPQKLYHPSNSIEINFSHNQQNLVNIFNITKRFYSYDSKTYLSTIATLCGCESIIIPNENETFEDIITNSPSVKYGVAFGLENINYAQITKP